ncbi:MAG: FG-GAP-like repeat-containing protein, partial [Phycisphaerales bacterium]
LGFCYEHLRFPQMYAANGNVANPRFCDFAFGDFNGDGYPDLFMTDYDTPETSGTQCIDLNQDGDTNDPGECQQSPAESGANDYNNRLYYNWGDDPAGPGPGHFYDTAYTKMSQAQLASAFGNAAKAADFNGDGHLDIARVNTLTGGQDVGILYANPSNLGNSFIGPVSASVGAPYNIEPGDLNGDGRIDLVVVDDGKDKYLINNGNNSQGQATFTSYTIADSLNEFGNRTRIADLDNDGLPDVLIADVDADLPEFCPSTGRRMHIYRNTGVLTAMLDEIGQIIPNAQLANTYDTATIDLDGDGWLDLVIARCQGVFVWMNQPPIGLDFNYPEGLPSMVMPGVEIAFPVEIAIAGGGQIVDGSANLMVSIDDGAWNARPLGSNGATWVASLPATDCGQSIRYYITAELSNGGVETDPSTAPATSFAASVSTGVELAYEQSFEDGDGGWVVENSSTMTIPGWQRAMPNATITGGQQAAPGNAPDGVYAFVTYNGPPGGTAGTYDLDFGPTILTSPEIVIGGAPSVLRFSRWFFCNDAGNTAEEDSLRVEISADNGASWQLALATSQSQSAWVEQQIDLASVLPPSETIRVRFVVNDTPNNSVTEAGIDAIRIERTVCEQGGPIGDLDGDGIIGGSDLAILLGAWNSKGGPADLDGDGIIGGSDLAILLSAWGG